MARYPRPVDSIPLGWLGDSLWRSHDRSASRASGALLGPIYLAWHAPEARHRDRSLAWSALLSLRDSGYWEGGSVRWRSHSCAWHLASHSLAFYGFVRWLSGAELVTSHLLRYKFRASSSKLSNTIIILLLSIYPDLYLQLSLILLLSISWLIFITKPYLLCSLIFF